MSFKGRGYIFAGKSGSGKTTLFIALLTQGWRLIGDDEVFVFYHNGWKVIGVSSLIKVTFDTYNFFREYLGFCESFKYKKSLDLAKYFPCQIGQEIDVNSIYLISQGGETITKPLSAIRALPEILSLSFLPGNYKLAGSLFNFWADIVKNIPVYSLEFKLDHISIYKCVINNL